MIKKKPRKDYGELSKFFPSFSISVMIELLEAMYIFYEGKKEMREKFMAENAKILRMLECDDLYSAVEEFKNNLEARCALAKSQGIQVFCQQINVTEKVIFVAFLHQIFWDKNLDLSNFLKFLGKFQRDDVSGDFILRLSWWARIAAQFLVDIDQYDERDVRDIVSRQHIEHRKLIRHFIALREISSKGSSDEFGLLEEAWGAVLGDGKNGN